MQSWNDSRVSSARNSLSEGQGDSGTRASGASSARSEGGCQSVMAEGELDVDSLISRLLEGE